MFEELGYERKTQKNFIIYTKNTPKYMPTYILTFSKEYKCVELESSTYFFRIRLDLNNAIQKQIEELGWDE